MAPGSRRIPPIEGPRARPARPRGRRRVVLAGLLASLAGLACASLPPVRSIQAARYYAAGTAALDRGEPENAIAALERASMLVPTASEIQNHLGLAYESGGRENDALAAFERAVLLDCDNEAARVNLARLRHASETGGTGREGAEGRSQRSASNGG